MLSVYLSVFFVVFFFVFFLFFNILVLYLSSNLIRMKIGFLRFIPGYQVSKGQTQQKTEMPLFYP